MRCCPYRREQVYRELAAMAGAGSIEAGAPGRRERVAYTLTEAGRAAFTGWVAREPGPETIRFPLLLAAIVGRRQTIHAARLAAYEQTASGLPPQAREAEPFRLATLDFGLAYERAVLDGFDGLPEAIRSAAPWPDPESSDVAGR